MKKLLLSVVSATLFTASLSGCATGPTAYGPAQGSGLGFASQKIESDRFHVNFTGRNADEARNLALLRSAELTKGEGFSHFRVIGSGTNSQDRGRSGISSSIGIGIGSGGGRYGRYGGSRTNVGIGIGVNDIVRAMQGNRVSASMEIILLNATDGLGDNVYEADSIIKSIQPQAFTN
ncbi:MAG: hypothetical protein L3J65_09330 [Robiginitomaculum sp.]|nr:hypothetical protein [Robiginitomaculum sp.]